MRVVKKKKKKCLLFIASKRDVYIFTCFYLSHVNELAQLQAICEIQHRHLCTCFCVFRAPSVWLCVYVFTLGALDGYWSNFDLSKHLLSFSRFCPFSLGLIIAIINCDH